MTSSKVCPQCGAARRAGARFCFECGATFDAAQDPIPTASSAEPDVSVTPKPPANVVAPVIPPPASAHAVSPATRTRPSDVSSSATILIALGSLTVLAGLGLIVAFATGALEDRYDVPSWFPILAGLSAAMGGLAIAAGFGVRRLDPTWRIVGIVVAVIGVIGMLINLISGVYLSFVLMFFWGQVIFRLARSGDAFQRASQ